MKAPTAHDTFGTKVPILRAELGLEPRSKRVAPALPIELHPRPEPPGLYQSSESATLVGQLRSGWLGPNGVTEQRPSTPGGIRTHDLLIENQTKLPLFYWCSDRPPSHGAGPYEGRPAGAREGRYVPNRNVLDRGPPWVGVDATSVPQARKELNPRPVALEATALPLSYEPLF